MEDAVACYCEATESGDMDAMRSTFAEDVRLPSPLFGRMTFKGRQDVGYLLAAVYGLLREVHWHTPVGEGKDRVVISTARIAGLKVDDAMVFELDEQGLIRRIRPHLRPLAATLAFALMIGPRVARRPGIVLTALRGN
jgi:hypothetical protein